MSYQLAVRISVLFCLSKKEPKKDLRKRNSPFSDGVFQLSDCTTVVNYSGTLIAFGLAGLKAQSVRINKHEKQMQKSQ
jgi:hypothetical protein